MQDRKYILRYQTCAAPTDLPPEDQELFAAARAALPHAYAPYSKFRVAAAARLASGEIVTGFNTENAAYPMCLCAERSALAAAASLQPEGKVVTMAITVKSPGRVLDQPASPCGACRQVLAEHEQRHGHDLRLILRAEAGPVLIFERAGDLLPFGFSGEFL